MKIATEPSLINQSISPQKITMTYTDFLAWVPENTHAEWVPLNDIDRGEVIVYRPAKLIHQGLIKYLADLLSLFVRIFNLGEVVIAPFEVKLSPDGSAREPDIFFVARANLDRLTNDRLQGSPDLAIEIVSKSSVKIDRDDKFKEYQAAGVHEYWIIDPRPGRQRADFYRRNKMGYYNLIATEEDERFESLVLPKFWLDPTWLWQADTRDSLLTFCEIADWPETLVQQIRAQMTLTQEIIE